MTSLLKSSMNGSSGSSSGAVSEGARRATAASVAVVTSIAFSIDTTLKIGAACYLLIAAPAVLLQFAGARPRHTVLRSRHPSKAANM